MRTALILLLMIFLTSCSISSEENKTSEKTDKQKEIVKETVATATLCEEIRTDADSKGKVVITDSNGQKESFGDYCPEKDYEAFLAFVYRYHCEGNTAKAKLTKCTGNTTCNKGECI